MEIINVRIKKRQGWYGSYFYKNKVIEVLATPVVKYNNVVYLVNKATKWINVKHCDIMPIEKEVTIICSNCGHETKGTTK